MTTWFVYRQLEGTLTYVTRVKAETAEDALRIAKQAVRYPVIGEGRLQ